MLTKFENIEDFLGDKNTRFFSNGYKRAIRKITNIALTKLGAEAICQVLVPGDWSMKGKTAQAVHLSSIDALLIALQLSEAYCVVRYQLSESQRKELVIKSFSMKADEAPLEDLDDFRATTDLIAINQHTLSFISNVGGMQIELKLILPILFDDTLFLTDIKMKVEKIENILDEPEVNFYGVRFSDATHDIKNVVVDLDKSSVVSEISADFPERLAYQGMETMFHRGASPIDAMVIISQLIQCYLYLLDGISRANSSTLWMRSMTLERSDEINQDNLSASIEVLRSEKILVDNIPWRCVYVRGHFDGMTIFYSVGHALPSLH